MLARLHVQNFKCLRDVDITFGPLTVLIGPNDSGKSSILDALRILGRTFREPLADIFRGDDAWEHLAWKGASVDRISWRLQFSDNGCMDSKFRGAVKSASGRAMPLIYGSSQAPKRPVSTAVSQISWHRPDLLAWASSILPEHSSIWSKHTAPNSSRSRPLRAID
ncbi:MAG TPA: AAA family ATPase [Nannocystis sp.]